ncbi:MAG: MMPL family transporter [Actinobacteria bacterium]|nr:MMPL family transporter [Actinomycetota bacterium]
MSRFISTGKLADKCARKPKTTILVWLLVAVFAFLIIARLLGSAVTAEMKFTRAPESQQGMDLLKDRLTGPQKFQEMIVISSDSLTVDDPAFKQQVEKLASDVSTLRPDAIEGATNYYQTNDASMVSADRHSTVMQVVMAGTIDDAEKNVVKLRDITHRDSQESGLSMMNTGAASTNNDMNELAKSDGTKSEIIGVVMALIILVIVFGTWISAGLPIALAIFSIIVALGITALVGQKFQMSFFAENMITMMGLAVGIDYTLFVVSRFREELAKGRDKYQAISIAGSTASRSVLFSGMTVILALVGMLMIPMSIFTSLGAGAIFVVAMAVAASLTLLPAILSLLGERVNSWKVPFVHRFSGGGSQDGRFWGWTTRNVMRRPALSILAVVALLGIPASFYFQMHTGASGIASLPDSFESKKAYIELDQKFSIGLIAPVQVVIDGDVNSGSVRQGMADLQDELKQDNDFYGAPQIKQNQAGDLAVMAMPVSGSADSDRAVSAVKRLRQDYIPAAFAGTGANVLVAGPPAMNADYFATTDTYRPIVVAFVLGLSFLLLMIVFRSLVVPLKAILMNLLSVGAAYGLIVLVFQKGVGASLFGFHQVESVEAWLPLFLFSVLFGLSMDYHVFLLGRIRERYLQTGDNSEAVAFGLKSTGRIITGAAVIMVAVFSGFASGQLIMFQQMGFGLAVAVLLDATLIRSVLVPASMKLLGDINWYLPSWLQWLPDLQLDAADGIARGEVRGAAPEDQEDRDAGTKIDGRPAEQCC